jgi:LuxR family maltose regulon positive regulatory protein
MQTLSTKLFIPPLRSKLVVRDRLVQKLNQGFECGLILVSAPAGYGKTTLLSAWIDQLPCAKAWLSLDEGDNDPLRFLTYLEAALRLIEPSITEVVKSKLDFPTLPDPETLLNPLINQLNEIDQSFYLVLDDYHVIQNQEVHQLISYLIEHHPRMFHLVLGTRADPPLPLSKLRARSDMLELRMAELRFTIEEASDFLTHSMGLNITSVDITSITKRTEGWIAGLQLAALSMVNADDVGGFITAFTGSHHYIFDYLLEEILRKQSAEIYNFLLYTSILEHLTAPLCDALFGKDKEAPHMRSSSVILEELEHANLFIVPLDHEQRWYRYHALFAELLQAYLTQKNPGQIPVLHTRASAWFEEQGLIPDALRHSFAAGDWEQIVRLVSANIFALLEQNELNSVARRFEGLQSERNKAQPWLLVGRGWLAAYTGQISSVEPILKLIENVPSNLDCTDELKTIDGHVAAIRAYANWIIDKRELAASSAQMALDLLPVTERLIRCQAATLLGLSLHDIHDKSDAFKQALAIARESNVSHVTIFAHGCWAYHLAIQGRMHEAHAACLEAIQVAHASKSQQVLPTLSHVYSTLSWVLREWNELDLALHYSKEAVNLAQRWEQADALHFAYDNLGHTLFAIGDINGAFDALHQAWQVARRTSPWFEEITISQEIEWYLAQGNLDAALQRLNKAQIDIDELSRETPKSFKSQLMPLSIVQIFIAQKQYSRALT